MKSSNTINIITRFFDLDSQRHVNNASYLSYMREGQFAYLKNLGYNFDDLEAKKVYLKPELIHISFLREQKSQVAIDVTTTACRFSNSLHFDHKICNSQSGDLAVHGMMLCSIDKTMLGNIYECVQEFPEPLIKWDIRAEFSGSCKRSMMEYHVRHIDLDGFNQCADTVLWRLNEEARWNFMKEVNMPFEYLFDNDTSLFWINGIYHYYGDVKLHDTLHVYTWISRCDNVRIYIRQEIYKNNMEHVLRSEGEFICVSLSRSKPTRIPEFLKSAIYPYLEQSA